MSIATLTRLASPAAPAPPQRGLEQDAQPSASEVQQTALEKITAFIPTEVIGIYVAGLGILSEGKGAADQSDGIGWGLFWLCLLVVPLLVAINVQIRNRAAADQDKVSRRKALLLCLFGAVAFSAWTAALPDTPFLALDDNANRIGSFAVVALGVLMPGVAQLVGLVPRS